MLLPPIIPTFADAREDLKSIIDRLFPAFQDGINEARDYASKKNHFDGSFFSHQVRFLAKLNLKNDGIEAEDCELEDTANSGLCLLSAKYRVRVLKSADGEIPDPGDSDRRKRYLNQQPEQQMELFEYKPVVTAGMEREPAHVVFLWEIDSEKFFTGVWVACPNGIGKYHFREWLKLPEAPAVAQPEQEEPPSDLDGIGKKIKKLPKTGTQDKE